MARQIDRCVSPGGGAGGIGHERDARREPRFVLATSLDQPNAVVHLGRARCELVVVADPTQPAAPRQHQRAGVRRRPGARAVGPVGSRSTVAPPLPVAARVHLAAVRVPDPQERLRQRHLDAAARTHRTATAAPASDGRRGGSGRRRQTCTRRLGACRAADVQPVAGCRRFLRRVRLACRVRVGGDLPAGPLRRSGGDLRGRRASSRRRPRRAPVAHHRRHRQPFACRRPSLPVDRRRSRSSDRTPPRPRTAAHDLPADRQAVPLGVRPRRSPLPPPCGNRGRNRPRTRWLRSMGRA